VGGKETLNSLENLPEEAWPTPITEKEPKEVLLGFKNGELIAVNNETFVHPVQAIECLQQLAQPFGIGRHIHVGDTIIGIKGRVGFEAAAPELIIKAHHLLEKHTLTKWQLFWKEQLANWYGNWLHEGQMLDPTMRDIEAFLTNTQKTVTGEVYITLFPYRYVLNGIKSNYDLMSDTFGSYGEMNNSWTGEDVKGFTKIFGNQTSIYHQVNKTVLHEQN
jgi:argininosuccinate synthase